MNLKEFESLNYTDKIHAAQKALAWFCVLTTVAFPFLDVIGKEEAETIKIILGKYANEKLEDKNYDKKR